jgi:hypothetical protein
MPQREKKANSPTSNSKEHLRNLLSELLWNVAAGEQDKVEKILKIHPELLLERGTVIDYPGRTFKKITAFELAYWNTDYKYMCNKILDCLPKNGQDYEIANALLNQSNKMDQDGITYTFHNQTITKKHYDYSPLINALQTYVDHFDLWTAAQCHTYWSTIVGKAQFETVAHVAQHYCDEVPFHPTPKFDAKTFNRSLKFHNFVTVQDESWWTRGVGFLEQKLGIDFGIYKGGAAAVCVVRPSRGRGAGVAQGRGAGDLLAIKTLYKIRMEVDLSLLKKRLQTIQKPGHKPSSTG